jgi:hypothetical protein
MMDKNREAFEAWCKRTRPVLSTLKCDPDNYSYSETDAAWRACKYLTKKDRQSLGIRVKGNEE